MLRANVSRCSPAHVALQFRLFSAAMQGATWKLQSYCFQTALSSDRVLGSVHMTQGGCEQVRYAKRLIEQYKISYSLYEVIVAGARSARIPAYQKLSRADATGTPATVGPRRVQGEVPRCNRGHRDHLEKPGR